MENSPASDLQKWVDYEELEWKEHSKQEYYWAQMCFISASAAGAKNIKLEDFLIKFGQSEEREMSQYEGMMHSKSCWEAITKKKAR